MAGTVMEMMFLANMGTMAKNDFNNMMNSSGGIALQNKVNGVKAGAANAFNGVGRKELALPGGGTIEWVEGKAVPIQFATGGNGGGVVPPIPPGGTNYNNGENENSQNISEEDEYVATPELKSHIKNIDPSVPRKNGIGGVHNKNEFLKNDVQILSSNSNSNIDGVEIIEYRISNAQT